MARLFCALVKKTWKIAQVADAAAAVLLTYFIHQNSHPLDALLRKFHLLGDVLGDDHIPTWNKTQAVGTWNI